MTATPETPAEIDWVTRLADEVIEAAGELAPGEKIVCASGISPSGPIPLGNFRELMTPHLVADEIKRRGLACEHILSWDDYDRFRRVPLGQPGVDESWNEHIGKPLTSVPAPAGSPHPNWAEHYKAPLREAMVACGIEVTELSQTTKYTDGDYLDQVLLAMRERKRIDDVLDRYRTLEANEKARQAATGKGSRKDQGSQKQGQKQAALTNEQQLAADEAAAGSGAATEDDGLLTSGEYYPYKPYCSVCGTDFTTVTAYQDPLDLADPTEPAWLTYTCRCGHTERINLRENHNGKLVWKVDWPMRWAYERVMFEPSGVDHQSPGSSFVVGKDLCPIFGWQRPIGPMYAFVGFAGMAKMSSSKGGVPTAADALQVMEPQILRWLYARRRPNQSFDIAFGPELQRQYDEWDSLTRKVADGNAQPGDLAAYSRATVTALGELPSTPHPVAFRTLASVADVTAGDETQTLRILTDIDPEHPLDSLDPLRPRLDCAQQWMASYVPEEDRTIVRDTPDTDLLASLTPEQHDALQRLVGGLDEHWSLDGLTTLVYGIPKLQAGLSIDEKALPPEVKKAQREFFVLLYRLLVSKETGPRLPTLLLAVGADRIRSLVQ